MKMNALFMICLRGAVLMASTFATTSWACSLAQQPSDLQFLQHDAGVDLRQPGAGADDQPPSRPVLSNFKVTVIENGCNGSGISCPENDLLSMNVNSTDNVTATSNLRYVAAFADNESAATTAPFEILFGPDISDASRVTAYLGVGQRSNAGFQRGQLCFALAAVDAAGNIGERSEAVCIDTTDRNASTTEVVQGHPCRDSNGCSAIGTSGVGMAFLFAVYLATKIRA